MDLKCNSSCKLKYVMRNLINSILSQDAIFIQFYILTVTFYGNRKLTVKIISGIGAPKFLEHFENYILRTLEVITKEM